MTPQGRTPPIMHGRQAGQHRRQRAPVQARPSLVVGADSVARRAYEPDPLNCSWPPSSALQTTLVRVRWLARGPMSRHVLLLTSAAVMAPGSSSRIVMPGSALRQVRVHERVRVRGSPQSARRRSAVCAHAAAAEARCRAPLTWGAVAGQPAGQHHTRRRSSVSCRRLLLGSARAVE